MKEKIIRFLALNRKNFIVRFLTSLAHSFIKGVENYSYNAVYNGERFVMDVLSTLKPEVVFDVGANRGDWSLIATRMFPKASIHCFEIAPPTFEWLKKNLEGQTSCTINPFGLSNNSGQIEINFSDTSDGHTTLLSEQPLNDRYRAVAAQTRSGDEYCSEAKIGKIDFLKIDVEGAENLVLQGFEKKLANGEIDVIQFEYGKSNIISHFLLKDFYELLEKHRFKVGKIYPNYVDFRKYSYDDENFIGPNFLAVRCELTDLIKKLTQS